MFTVSIPSASRLPPTVEDLSWALSPGRKVARIRTMSGVKSTVEAAQPVERALSLSTRELGRSLLHETGDALGEVGALLQHLKP